MEENFKHEKIADILNDKFRKQNFETSLFHKTSFEYTLILEQCHN